LKLMPSTLNAKPAGVVCTVTSIVGVGVGVAVGVGVGVDVAHDAV